MPCSTELISGFLAGCATTIVCQPMDKLKVQRQVELNTDVSFGRTLQIARSIINLEGISGFYRGFTPNLVGNASCWALYFMWYEKIKTCATSVRGRTPLTSLDYFLASSCSSILTTLCTNPIWVLKTRMLASSTCTDKAYRNAFTGLRDIFQHEGTRGFYKGLTPSLLGVPQYALQFSAYERLKLWRGTDPLGNIDIAVLSAVSKVLASTLMYPHQLVRSRMQNSRFEDSRSMGVFVRGIWRAAGLRGFYQGLVLNLARVVPSTCVTFLVYENVHGLLLGGNQDVKGL